MKTNLPYWVIVGLASLTLTAAAATRYVDLNNPSPIPPYTTWNNAATNIQDAIDVANIGDIVLVADGIYATGGKLVGESPTTNRIATVGALTVLSVNGPAQTIIDGSGMMRCALLANGTVLSGFTMTNGVATDAGGGIWCVSTNATVTNCILTGNAAPLGGGSYRGTLRQCILRNNSGDLNDAGASGANLSDCEIAGNGGGVSYSTLEHCRLIGNAKGTFYCTLRNCLLADNASTASFGGMLFNCSIIGNAYGMFGGTAVNCIVYYNDLTGGQNYGLGEIPGGLSYCCTTPLPPAGAGNFTNPPALVSLGTGNYRLQSNSPCINSGKNAIAANPVDLDGQSRVVGGTVDLGAYEYQTPASLLSSVWAQQYGVPIDGSADYLDPDSDGMANWAECRADTDPTNAASALRMEQNIYPGKYGRYLVMFWQSVPTRTYWLERSTNLAIAPAFQVFATNVPSEGDTTVFYDAVPASGGPYYYRVGVE